ncbi:MAG: cytochrome c oxidase subunit II [Gammaproteobacteria bacterium]|nr:cytochrome c oxidase subunit II [Gammaproteobacteria bacterium]
MLLVIKKLGSLVLCAFGLLASSVAMADYQLNMTPGVTQVSRDVYWLHSLVLVFCVVIALGVFGAMIYSLIYHRKSKGAVAAQFHENTAVEIAWTVIPFIALIGLAIPATKTLIELEDSSDPDMSIKVTGYQWKWQYEYLDEGISFFSNLSETSRAAAALGQDPTGVENYLLDVDNPIVVPINKKVRFLVTANDVIHSWWVPALGWKQDAIPGFINTAWTKIDEPGTYRGQCAELCGKDHGYMPVVLIAKTEEDYAAWVAEQQAAAAAEASGATKTWALADLMAKGERVYATNCAACHQPNGQGIPPAFPSLVTSPLLGQPVAEHINVVVNGRPGTAMQAFGAQLSDVDLAAVVTYERNAWGIDSGEIVQPAEAKAAR